MRVPYKNHCEPSHATPCTLSVQSLFAADVRNLRRLLRCGRIQDRLTSAHVSRLGVRAEDLPSALGQTYHCSRVLNVGVRESDGTRSPTVPSIASPSFANRPRTRASANRLDAVVWSSKLKPSRPT